jgi:hypothetical protein
MTIQLLIPQLYSQKVFFDSYNFFISLFCKQYLSYNGINSSPIQELLWTT